MKKVIWFVFVIHCLSLQMWAGSITGEISYSGSFENTVFIAAFNNPTLDGDPLFVASIAMPGSYQLTDLPDGTYYIVSIMSENSEYILATDPYGFWGTLEGFSPVNISDNGDITDINITLIDGTTENPNPFAQYSVAPDEKIELPELTVEGTNTNMFFSNSLLYLYKHDYEGAPSAKVYEINPNTGEVTNTIYLSLESSPNRISWMDKMVYRGDILWAVGGYGDPAGSGYIQGVFQVDLNTSNSSHQIPFVDIESSNGLACDGTNFYVGVEDTAGMGYVVKFNPDEVSEIPNNKFIDIGFKKVKNLNYSDNLLWLGTKKVDIYDPNSGDYIDSLELQASAAEILYENKFWSYDQRDNSIKVYYKNTVDVKTNGSKIISNDLTLLQNYPNPFNPTTNISYSIQKDCHVNLSVYDILGNKVEQIENGIKTAGSYNYNFDASELSSGIYFYRIRANNFIQTKKMLLIK